MNKLIYSLCAAGLLTISLSASAASALDSSVQGSSSTSGSSKTSSSADMTAMDTNGDGLISRDEFMSHQERSYDSMQKNSAGMLELDSETKSSVSGSTGDTESDLNSGSNTNNSSIPSSGSRGTSGSGGMGSGSGSGGTAQ